LTFVQQSVHTPATGVPKKEKEEKETGGCDVHGF
jgi:hypothetical protein